MIGLRVDETLGWLVEQLVQKFVVEHIALLSPVLLMTLAVSFKLWPPTNLLRSTPYLRLSCS